jgi:cyclic pyranopterin phosphate synthase
LVALGQEPEVATERVSAACAGAEPPPESIEPLPDPHPEEPPQALRDALGEQRPLSAALWSVLTPLDRYALVKVASRGKPERLEAAYRELVGQSAASTHVGPAGGVRMVSVSAKSKTLRRAVAESWVTLSPEAFARLNAPDAPKGDVLGTARLAGIQGAKRTADLIPLCHPLSLTHVQVSFELFADSSRIRVLAEVEVIDRTGVEMEAMVAATTASLTIYDMLKSIDRFASIGPARLLEKSGGRSGHLRASQASGSAPSEGLSRGNEAMHD